MQNVLKIGSGRLLGVRNSIPQPHKMVSLIADDNRIIFNHSLAEVFTQEYPDVERTCVVSTGSGGELMGSNKFELSLTLETDGIVSVYFK